MISVFKSSTPRNEEEEVNDDEVTCPLCDSYDVEDKSFRYSCFTCGTTWKILKTSSV